MIVHVFVVAVMIAVVAAFLILWYFWAKKRLTAADFTDEQETLLVPFKYFSWVFLALLIATCVVQIHFIRVSATVHERLADMSAHLKDRQGVKEESEEIKRLVVDLRKDMESGFARMLTWKLAQMAQAVPQEASDTTIPMPSVSNKREKSIVAMSGPKKRPKPGNGFANEAKASSSGVKQLVPTGTAIPGSEKQPSQQQGKVYSMQLNVTGRVTASALSVRNQPDLHGLVVERLVSGENVKVTEKRLMGEGLWYRVITPLGRAGWVDHRHLKLDLTSAT